MPTRLPSHFTPSHFTPSHFTPSHFTPSHYGFLAVAAIACVLAVWPRGAQAGDNDVYLQLGVPGLTIGTTQNVDDTFALRLQVSTLGSIPINGQRGNVNYDGRLTANTLGLYADGFVSGPFRITGGVSLNDFKYKGTAQPSKSGTVTINNYTVAFGAGDTFDVQAKFPAVTPYLGIGWGHHRQQTGWGFVGDLGLMFGSFKTSVTASPSVQQRIAAAGGVAQAEIDAERDKAQKEFDKYKVIPVLMLGVSYRW